MSRCFGSPAVGFVFRRAADSAVGFAGSAADCLALLELLEKEFEKYPD